MIDVDEVVSGLAGRGFEKVAKIDGSTFKDNSTVIVTPTRGSIHHRVVAAFQGLMAPMNQKRAWMFAAGHEVGKAYDELIKGILANPELAKWKYVLTVEDDNIIPPDAHIRLLESIEMGPFDASAGIYFTKGDYQMPMAYGDAEEYARTGVLDFRPLNVAKCIERGNVVEVNGVAMGCTLYRMDLFRTMEPPWFVTVNDVFEGGAKCFTQDLYFCERAKRAGKRFAVDCRVKVGHLDVTTGEVY